MSIKSTYNIERQLAIDIIISKVNECTNEQLANMLLEFDESYYRNYQVNDKLEGDSWWTIKTVDDFNNDFVEC